jgi:hypothetical protein
MWVVSILSFHFSPSMPITDAEILALKPKAKSYKVSIGKGAYILVRPDGAKYFRFKYFLSGKEGIYAIGVFPEVSVREAELARDAARAIVRQGLNPTVARRQAKVHAVTAQALARAVFRLGISNSGALTIETDKTVLTLTDPQTRALRAFLAINNESEEDVEQCR